MNTHTLIAAAAASILLVACAAAPVKPDGAEQVRSKLTQLQSDPHLGSLAPVAMKDAEAAVSAAETPTKDVALAEHRVYIADRKVETAKAQAETRYAEDQRSTLVQQRESARLDARTREADAAKTEAATARAEGAQQKVAADAARDDAETARLAATELQRQIDELQARPTDRGLVLTLGDVLFATGKSDLKSGATGNMNKLVAFLNQYPDRKVTIEGYTDAMGSDEYNQDLSQRRADAVKSYLIDQGVSSQRLAASGRGESAPVADNDTAAGRQRNRRVEVIIGNPATALR